jgi:transposase
MTAAARRAALEVSGLVHPNPEAVTAGLFDGRSAFFMPEDKVQVKYEMLRAHIVDGVTVSAAADAHGYSRASFYLVAASFSESGMNGLLDERRGRQGPLKLSPEIVAFIAGADPGRSGADLADAVALEFGVSLHRRTVERARTR